MKKKDIGRYMKKIKDPTETDFIFQVVLIGKRIILVCVSFNFDLLSVLNILIFIIVVDEDDFIYGVCDWVS